MTSLTQAFANMPQAVEANMTQRTSVNIGLKKTLVLRGWRLVVSAFLCVCFLKMCHFEPANILSKLDKRHFLQKYFWKETGFVKLKDVPGLDITPRHDVGHQFFNPVEAGLALTVFLADSYPSLYGRFTANNVAPRRPTRRCRNQPAISFRARLP